MILINKGENKKIYFTIAPTITPVYYLFEFVSNNTGNLTYMMADDISTNSSVYKTFLFQEGSTQSMSGGFIVNPGTYDYNLYETGTQSLNPLLATSILEIGLMTVVGNDMCYTPDIDEGYVYYDECSGPSVIGITGPAGTSGTSGVGVPAGGLTGQVLAKINNDNYNTEWVDQTGGGGGSTGTSGSSGTSGTSGVNGLDGSSGSSGINGLDGSSGINGTSGINGLDGSSGINGTSGINGLDGSSGINGTSGLDGSSGSSGVNGSNGLQGNKAGLQYEFSTSTSSGNPGSGILKYNSSTLSSVTQIVLSTTTFDALSVANILALIDDSNSTNKAIITITSNTNGDSSFFSFLVTSIISHANYYELNGTFVAGSAFSNTEVIAFNFSQTGNSGSSGSSGVNGLDGSSGTSGVNGLDGTSGINGLDGTSGINGLDGSSGSSGVNGSSGSSGVNGLDGSSGTSGINGLDGSSGSSGSSGVSGSSGINGLDGSSGVNGTSGINGLDGSSGSSGVNGLDGSSGVNGTSGINGLDGSSGTSGVNGTSGINGVDGSSGSSGVNGVDGSSGSSGINGTSGSAGTSGSSGTSPSQTLEQTLALGNNVGSYAIVGSYSTSLSEIYMNNNTSPTSFFRDYLLLQNSFIPNDLYRTRLYMGTSSLSLQYVQPNYGLPAYTGFNLQDGEVSISGDRHIRLHNFNSEEYPGDWNNYFNLETPGFGGYSASFYLATDGNTGGHAIIGRNSTSENTIRVEAGNNSTSGVGRLILDAGADVGSIGASGSATLTAQVVTIGEGDALITLDNYNNGINIDSPVVNFSANPSYSVSLSHNTYLYGITSSVLAVDSTGKIIGTSSVSGTSGSSGTSGVSGTSGINGVNGTSGINGSSGIDGVNGTSGTSGQDGVFSAGTLMYQSGTFSSLDMTGTPLYYDVNFIGTFVSNYRVIVDSLAPRDWTISNQTSSSFRINSNSSSTFNEVIEWSAIEAANGTIGAFIGATGPTGSSGTSGTSLPPINTFTTLTTSALIKATASSSYMLGFGLTSAFGSAFTFTPSSVGVINVLVKSSTNTQVSNEINYELRYGTGTAPSAGSLASGTSIDSFRLRNTTINVKNGSLILSSIVSGLTTGVTYWFDVSALAASTGDLALNDVRINVFELR